MIGWQESNTSHSQVGLKLKNGGKAPENYEPLKKTTYQKDQLIEETNSSIKNLNNHIEKISEEENETLLIPHPLLGKITLKENKLCNTIYHVEHHQLQVEQNLNSN